MKDFRDLKVWEKAHQLTLELYKVTKTFPSDERFGLISQIRRCAASVPANIAEGCGRRGNGEFSRFLQIAAGSANELAYHCVLAKDLGYVTVDAYEAVEKKITEVQRMLGGLTKVDEVRLDGNPPKFKARGNSQ